MLPLSKFIGAKFSLNDASTEFAMDDDEAEFMLEILNGVDWSDPVCAFGEYLIRSHDAWEEGANVGLFHGERIVGFYEGPNLWVDPDYRRLGLAIPLILSAAKLRGGSVLPPDFDTQGYSPAGLLAHAEAHLQTLLCAIKKNEPIPEEVLREYNIKDARQFIQMFDAKSLEDLSCCPPSKP
jgi:GNAT superfamily N-acetyltransferase